MKVGDPVIFTAWDNLYAKYFAGKIAVVKSVRINSSGEKYCSVQWLIPVKYYDKWVGISSFNAKYFEVYDGNE